MNETIKATVRYVGTPFAGWQVQPAQRTVQGEIEAALAQIANTPVRIHGAGRTDAGVHALAQVISFAWPAGRDLESLRRSLSKMLAPDILVTDITVAPEGFHARKSATGKHYAYSFSTARETDPFLAPFVWTLPPGVNLDQLHALCSRFEGTHDFAGFQCAGAEKESTVRTLHKVDIEPGGIFTSMDASGIYRINFHGDGFLYKMVRNITGTLVDVARGQLPESRLQELLNGPGPYKGYTAPAHGLALAKVKYDTPTPAQYAANSVQRYEWIFGEGYLSSGAERIARHAAETLPLQPGHAVLDIGSGLGGTAFLFAEHFGAHVTGIDLLDSMTQEARIRATQRNCAGARFIAGDFLHAQLPADSFDAVYSKDSFLHIPDKAMLLSRIFRVLKPGGRVFFTDYLRADGVTNAEFDAYVTESGYHLATHSVYAALLRTAGFEAITHHNITPDLLALLAQDLSRLQSAPAHALDDAARAYLRARWELKLRCCEANAMQWGMVCATKPRGK